MIGRIRLRSTVSRWRSSALAPWRQFTSQDPEQRSGFVGLLLLGIGLALGQPGLYVPGGILAAVGFREALPLGHPFVAVAITAAVTILGAVAMVVR